MSDALSVYVHIPWCRTKCPYCDFNTYAAQTWPEARYADALVSELTTLATRPGIAGRRLETVFFGGGTPSLFAPNTIERVIDAARDHFDCAPDLEVTLEANPGSSDQERLEGLRAGGVNRISFGAQSFQTSLLERLGRQHTPDDTRRAVDRARRAGFENLSLDLIYAVPGQTVDDLAHDLDEILRLRPEHVSTYNLTYEKGTPLHRDRELGRVEPVAEETEIEMFERVRRELGQAGFEHYEISNHALPGRPAKHNQAYWRGHSYLGLGAGAHSFAAAEPDHAPWGRRWWNLRDPAEYMDRATDQGSAIDDDEVLSRSTAMGETCWLGLRELRGIRPSAFGARFGISLDAAFPEVDAFVERGWLRHADDRLTLTDKGLLVADEVFASFFLAES